MSRVPTPPHGAGRGEGGGTLERVLFPASIPRPVTSRHAVADTSAAAGSHHEHTRRGHQASITGTLGRPLSASGDVACLAAGSEGNEGGNGAGEQTHPSIMSRVPTPPHGSGRGEGGEVPRNESYFRHRSHDPRRPATRSPIRSALATTQHVRPPGGHVV